MPNWLPGISGNPGGRSRELAQQQNAARLEAASHASEAIAYLLKVLRSEEEGTAHRLKAGIELLNRGLGLPQAQIDVDVIVRRKISEMMIGRRRLVLTARRFYLRSKSSRSHDFCSLAVPLL